jgi:hypothetical protein
MAKFENELDLNEAKKIVLKRKNEVAVAIGQNKALGKAIDTLVKNKAVTCFIFSKSIAFRIGKSSIKSIPGFSSGFKSGLDGTAKDLFKNLKFSGSKKDDVVLAACHFIINHFDRVKSESDKTEAVESEQVVNTKSQLDKLIEEYGSVRLMVGDEIYQVDGFDQVAGRPKADMVFTFEGKQIVFVSHKKGSRAGDFQQYGGFSSDLGIKTDSDINRAPIIKKFVEDVEKIFEAFGLKRDDNNRFDFNELVKGSNFARLMDDENMAYTVMFGKDYQTKKPGLDNCSILIDGDILFEPVKGKGPNVFRLCGSYHDQPNPCLMKTKPSFSARKDDIYSPVMFLIKSEQQGLNQGGFSNVRAVIWPNNKVASGYAQKFEDILRIVKSKDTGKIADLRKQMVKQ